jgi:hypothetical protein
MSVVLALGLQAQELMVVSGSSSLQRGKVKSTTLGSIRGIPLPRGPFTGVATLDPLIGPPFEVPCEVRTFPGDTSRSEIAVWSFALPVDTRIKGFRIRRDSQALGALEAPEDPKPAELECADAWSDKDVSLAWIIKRTDKPNGTSMWVRWSRDGGATWMGQGQLIPDDTLDGQLDFKAAEVGDPAGMIVEFWVPQGLRLTRLRHTIAR